jgi:hypothetical protein
VVTEGVHLVREGEALDIAGPDTGAAISEAAPRPQGRSGT